MPLTLKSKPTSLLKRTYKYALFAVLAISVATAYWLFMNKPKETRAGWWNDSWSYRKAIPVANNITVETNVYISVTLNTDTGSTTMQSDCGDFRFINLAGEVLPYYIVSGCRTATNVIHVFLPVFPPGDQAIYFYYGNPTAENGFALSDFPTPATNYSIGTVQALEYAPGPLGYWPFDEGHGTAANDQSGHDRSGTINGNPVWQDESMCVAGKCLYFDGSGDYIEINDFDF